MHQACFRRLHSHVTRFVDVCSMQHATCRLWCDATCRHQSTHLLYCDAGANPEHHGLMFSFTGSLVALSARLTAILAASYPEQFSMCVNSYTAQCPSSSSSSSMAVPSSSSASNRCTPLGDADYAACVAETEDAGDDAADTDIQVVFAQCWFVLHGSASRQSWPIFIGLADTSGSGQCFASTHAHCKSGMQAATSFK